MEEKDTLDLFDFLGISIYEHSYTSILATLFNNPVGQEWARRYFEKSMRCGAPDGQIKAITQLHIRHQRGGTADRLDLVLTFGKPVTDIWLIEAKIKSGESSDQLRRYERYGKDEEAQRKLMQQLGLKGTRPDQVRWRLSYLTLEEENPSGPTAFRSISYELLREILPANPDLPSELSPAYRCLYNRLVDYYTARGDVLEDAVPSEDMKLIDYLSSTCGLIDEASRFYWLTRRIAEDAGLRSTIGKTSQSNPFCQLRDKHWQGEYYEEIEVSLQDCFDIHLELQLSNKNVSLENKNVSLKLHFESNPYMPGLNKKAHIPELQRKELWNQRKSFLDGLALEREKLEEVDWKLDNLKDWSSPPPRAHHQLARFPSFDLGKNVTVGEFRGWVRQGIQSIRPYIEGAGKKSNLW